MERSHNIAVVKGLRKNITELLEDVESILNDLDRGTGAREVALTKTKLQEARQWTREALEELEKL